MTIPEPHAVRDEGGTEFSVARLFARFATLNHIIAEPLDTIGKELSATVTIGGIAIVILLAVVHGIFFPTLSLTVTDLSAKRVMKVASKDLAKLGAFDGYAFDRTGERFDFRTDPSRMGYIVQYKGAASGIGKCVISFDVQDGKTDAVIVPATKIEAISVVRSGDFSNEFFVAAAPGSPPPSLAVTARSDENSSAQSALVPLVGQTTSVPVLVAVR